MEDQFGTLQTKMDLLVELGKQLGRSEVEPSRTGTRGKEAIESRIKELKAQIRGIAER